MCFILVFQLTFAPPEGGTKCGQKGLLTKPHSFQLANIVIVLQKNTTFGRFFHPKPSRGECYLSNIIRVLQK